MLVIGAGNPDIIRIIEDINSEKKTYNFIGFLEKNKELFNTEFWNYPILGSDELLDKKPFCDASIINNVYNNQNIRRKTFEKLKKYENRFCNLIHPSTRIGKIEIGSGNILYDGVIIQTGVIVGHHNVIYSSSIISHEAVIGNNCLISVNVSIGARSQIGDFCFFGIGATTFPSLFIMNDSFVGGGAILMNNLGKNEMVSGFPAKKIPNINLF